MKEQLRAPTAGGGGTGVGAGGGGTGAGAGGGGRSGTSVGRHWATGT